MKRLESLEAVDTHIYNITNSGVEFCDPKNNEKSKVRSKHLALLSLHAKKGGK